MAAAAAPRPPPPGPASSTASTAPTKVLQGGVVRSCPSGDTLVVRPRGVATPGAEKTIHIAGIGAPRLGSREREDDVSMGTWQERRRDVTTLLTRLVTLFIFSFHPAVCLSLPRVPSQAPGGPRSAISSRVQRPYPRRRCSRVCPCLSSPGEPRVSECKPRTSSGSRYQTHSDKRACSPAPPTSMFRTRF